MNDQIIAQNKIITKLQDGKMELKQRMVVQKKGQDSRQNQQPQSQARSRSMLSFDQEMVEQSQRPSSKQTPLHHIQIKNRTSRSIDNQDNQKYSIFKGKNISTSQAEPNLSDQKYLGKQITLNQKHISVQTGFNKQYRHVCIQVSNQSSTQIQTDPIFQISRQVQAKEDQQDFACYFSSINPPQKANFASQSDLNLDNNLNNPEPKIEKFYRHEGVQTLEKNFKDESISAVITTENYQSQTQYFCENAETQTSNQLDNKFQTVSENFLTKIEYSSNQNLVEKKLIQDELIEPEIQIFLELQEKNQELVKSVEMLEAQLQQRDIQLIKVINDIRQQAPEFEKNRIQEYLLQLSEAESSISSERQRLKQDRRKIVVHYSVRSIYLIEFLAKGSQDQSTKFVGSLFPKPKEFLQQIEFEIDDSTSVKCLKGLYDDDLNVQEVIVIDQKGIEVKFTNFSLPARKLQVFQLDFEDKRTFHFVLFKTIEKKFFVYKQLICQIGYYTDNQIYPEKKDESDIVEVSHIFPIYITTQMDRFNNLDFTDENTAERFQMLEEFFVIKSFLFYYDETCGFFGIQALYFLSNCEWSASYPHKSLSSTFSLIKPIKSIDATLSSFKNHDKKILMSIAQYKDLETQHILRFELLYKEQEEEIIVYGRDLDPNAKIEKKVIKVSPNSYLFGSFAPLLGICKIYQLSKGHYILLTMSYHQQGQ